MDVYRERNTPLFEVPPHLWLNQDIPLTQELEACIRGTRVLVTIIEDLVCEVQRSANIRPNTVKDIVNLITLVSYFLYEPLVGVWSAQAEAPNEDPKSAALQADYTVALDGLLSCLYNALVLAQRTLRHYSDTTRMIQQVYEFSKSYYYENNIRLKIPAFSPLELLLRVVAAREQWVDHEALFEAYRKLKVRHAIYPADSIPKAGFACLGMKTNGHPTCVLAFSADYWEGYSEMNKFVKKLRDSRRNAFDRAQLRKIVKWSRTLYDRYPQETLLNLIATPPGSFNHEEELASPFHCHSFRPRDRCTRCQALFQYAVTQVVRGLETDQNRKIEGRKPNKNWSCAEVYAHFFCQQLSDDGSH